jgi:hypothetical protein
MMRKVLISLAAAGTALAFATPASAQFYPAQSQGYAYQGQPSAFGYNRGGTRALQHRVDRIQRDIEQLRARRIITRNEANGLRSEARQLERRLYQASRNGLRRDEMRNIEYRIARLEQHVRREATDGNRRYGNGYNQYGADRDRDGRDDRYEDDRGRDRDD